MEKKSLFGKMLTSRRTNDLYPPSDDDIKDKYPNLWEFMTHTYIDEETYKDPAKLNVSMGVGCFTVELIDSALGFMVNTTTERLDGVLDAMEQALTSPNPPIKYFKDSQIKVKKRPKKTKDEE